MWPIAYIANNYGMFSFQNVSLDLISTQTVFRPTIFERKSTTKQLKYNESKTYLSYILIYEEVFYTVINAISVQKSLFIYEFARRLENLYTIMKSLALTMTTRPIDQQEKKVTTKTIKQSHE